MICVSGKEVKYGNLYIMRLTLYKVHLLFYLHLFLVWSNIYYSNTLLCLPKPQRSFIHMWKHETFLGVYNQSWRLLSAKLSKRWYYLTKFIHVWLIYHIPKSSQVSFFLFYIYAVEKKVVCCFITCLLVKQAYIILKPIF